MKLRACATSSFNGLRGTKCSMFALDDMGNLKIIMSEMETTTISSAANDMGRPIIPRQLCFNIDWKPDFNKLSPRQLLNLCEQDSTSHQSPDSSIMI